MPVSYGPLGGLFAKAKTTDPDSSHIAATNFDQSGQGKVQREKVLAAVRRFPGRTAGELAKMIKTLDRVQVARRLSELKDVNLIARGKARKCGASGRTCCTWLN